MEAIIQPLQVVRSLYAARGAGNEDFGVKDRFKTLLADPSCSAQVPVLTERTAELLPNQCLARFRGMVQDMLNPEYYVGEYQRPDGSWATARYADQVEDVVVQGAHSCAHSKIAERRPVLLAPVPGEAGWVAGPAAVAARASLAAVLLAGGTARSAAAGKRAREVQLPGGDAGEGEHGGADAADTMSVSMLVSEASGRTLVDDGDSAASRARLAGGHGDGQPGAAAPQQQEANSGCLGLADDLPPGCCMAYLYDDQDVKLNDVVEVVGVLSRVPELAAAHLGPGGGDDQAASLLQQDLLASHLPTSQVPRLHAILMSTEGALQPVAPPVPAADVAEARARVLGFLSQVLGGDDVAAEYLLLQLVGRAHHRTADAAVGLLSLNLLAPSAAAHQPPPQQAGQRQEQELSALGGALAAALAALSPRCLALPLSVAALNRRPWWPRRDQNTQRLLSAPLQFAAGTQVVLDETVMAAGTLSEVGLRNLAAIESIMARQKLGYDFEFFALDQPTDAPVTILSQGRSLLRGAVAVAVPLCPTAPPADAAGTEAAAAAANLGPLRAYLAAARALEFAIPPDMEVFLSQELAAARHKDRGINERTFHTWMNLARLQAVSHGETSLTQERWLAMRHLEAQRLERLKGTAAA